MAFKKFSEVAPLTSLDIAFGPLSEMLGNHCSIYIRYDDINGGAKCRKRSGLGRLGVTQGHRQCHHSIERMYDFIFNYY